MQLMVVVAGALLVVAVGSGFVYLVQPAIPLVLDQTRKRLPRRIGGLVLASLALLGLLAFAQREVCVVLGGTWIDTEESCRDELGGNGNNDPSLPSFGHVYDPVDGGR